MLTLYGPKLSSAWRCLWMLEEMGAAYAHKDMDWRAGDMKKPEYLALNPNGKVPTLTDGDFVLWESMAINAYLAEKYDPDLYGKSPEDRGKILQWSFWSIIHVQPDVEAKYLRDLRQQPDTAADGKAQATLSRFATVLDEALAGKQFLVGGQFSLADLNCGSVFAYARDAALDLSAFSNLTRWLDALTARPAYRKSRG